MGGHARLNPANVKAAGLKSTGPMRVEVGGRDIILTVVSDGTVGKDEVVVRTPDLKRLKVSDGATVTVLAHEPVMDTARREAQEAGEAIREAAHETKEAAIRARGRVKKARVKATKRLSRRVGRKPRKPAGAPGKPATGRKPSRST